MRRFPNQTKNTKIYVCCVQSTGWYKGSHDTYIGITLTSSSWLFCKPIEVSYDLPSFIALALWWILLFWVKFNLRLLHVKNFLLLRSRFRFFSFCVSGLRIELTKRKPSGFKNSAQIRIAHVLLTNCGLNPSNKTTWSAIMFWLGCLTTYNVVKAFIFLGWGTWSYCHCIISKFEKSLKSFSSLLPDSALPLGR